MKRMTPQARRDQIWSVVMKLAKSNRYDQLTREQIAEAAKVSAATVSKYFGTMPNLRRDIMRDAVRNNVWQVIAQGVVAGDKQAMKAPAEVRAEAMRLAGSC